MKIGINIGELLNQSFNEQLLNGVGSQDERSKKVGSALIHFANKYGFYGIDAINFVLDMFETLNKLEEEDK